MFLFGKDIFGHSNIIKKLIFITIGLFTYPRFMWLNRMKIEGTEYLKDLPDSNVLFVSNHQTYYADVMAFNHVFGSIKCGFSNSLKNPVYIFNPRINTYYIAARETMKAGLLPRIFAYAGSISIKRTWREAGKEVNRKVDLKDISNIGKALSEGWVITFPQGTTTPYAPGRRGSMHIIRKFQPVVVPVVINGFRRAFDKKGLKLKKKGTDLTIRFKPPMLINYNEDSELLLNNVMFAIEQSEEFQHSNEKISVSH